MASLEHRFGGGWTEEKLQRIKNYLTEYRKVFNSPKGKFFTTWYVDGFAGTGFRSDPGDEIKANILQTFILLDEDLEGTPPKPKILREGSAQIALNLKSPFDRYLFIDRSRSHIKELRSMLNEQYPHLAERCTLRPMDANEALQQWCKETNWSVNRAVVFLDPYGMQVEWETVEALACTKAVDLWYLFPLSSVVRMMPTRGATNERWQNRLDRLFGTREWYSHFYPTRATLIEGVTIDQRNVSLDKLQQFITARLNTCFESTVEGLVLSNSRGSPMFSLCFAAANKRGAKIATRIAGHILHGKAYSEKRQAGFGE